MKKLLTVVVVVAAAFAAEGYKVLNKIKIGGTGGWDYCSMDNAARRLYASHGTSVEVVDVDAGKVVGSIPQLHGVHGIAVAADLNKGFISNGQSNSVTIFDLKTLAKLGEPAAGTNPDSICYEPKTQRVFTFNGRSNDSTAINAKTGEPLSTFPVGGKPEFCVADGTGKLFVNLEDRSELVEIDAAKPAALRHASLAPCDEPSGLAIDRKDSVVFSVCGNKMMAVTDIKAMKVIATPAIGQGPDAAGLRSRHRPRLQLQWGWNIDHREKRQRQVGCRRHRDDRARRPHHDGGREDAPRLPVGRGIRSHSGT